MKASDAVAQYLVEHKVVHCFDLAGGMITHLLDSLSKRNEIVITPMHHEQGAAFAAEGIARATKGKELGLAMGTSGPGATNLLTGLCSCWFDSVPCLFITGQVNESELRGESGVRQQGFQELDIVSMVKGVTKYSAQVRSGASLLPELHKACCAAISGRKGPVLLDITFNAQREEVDDRETNVWMFKEWRNEEPVPEIGAGMDQLAMMCASSCKPLVCFGGGAIWADSFDRFVEYLRENKVPYVSTLMGAQRMERHELYLGMLGTYGRRSANWAVQNCDLLIAVGSRLDVRQTGAFAEDFARKARIVQMDIDASQLNNRVKVDLAIHGDAEAFFSSALSHGLKFNDTKDWTSSLPEKRKCLDLDEYAPEGLTPYRLFQALNTVSSGEPLDYVADVGNHQMWAACLLDLSKGQRVHFSGGLGAMGFGLPVSIGIAMKNANKVANLTGDGSVQINIQELDTLKRLDLDVCVIVMNNSSLGMVKNFQDMYFEGNNQSTVIGFGNPDFVSVAKAYGLKACRVKDIKEFNKAYQEALTYHHPSLIEVMMVDGHECKPRLVFGGKLDEQFPPLKE